MKNLRRNAVGLSLIELLMASVLVAAAGVLLVSGLLGANRGADLRVRQILSAQALASQLALLDDHVAGTSGAVSGTLPPPLEAFRWTRQWEPLTDSMARLTITVSDGTVTNHVVTDRPIAEP